MPSAQKEKITYEAPSGLRFDASHRLEPEQPQSRRPGPAEGRSGFPPTLRDVPSGASPRQERNPSEAPSKAEGAKGDKKVLETILVVAKEFFIFSLIFYLLLFILETVFPGFVSNNFDLNWVLAGVLVLGVVSAFAPEEKESAFASSFVKTSEDKEATADKEEKPKVLDYLTSIFLGLLGGVLIYYKIQLAFYPRLIISLIIGALIITFSLILLLVEDEEVEEKEEEIETFFQNTFFSRKTFTTPIAFFRLLLFKKVNFPVFLILIIFLFASLSLPKKSGISPRKINLGGIFSFLKSSPAPQKISEPSPTAIATKPPAPVALETEKKATPSAEIMVKVLNGGGEKSAAGDFAKVLKTFGFKKVFFGDADNFKYKNVTIKFRSEDEEQAGLIEDLLKDKYPAINKAPSGTASAEMTVILGSKESEKTEEGITILTPE